MVKIRCKRCTKFFERGYTQKKFCQKCKYVKKEKFCTRCKKIIKERNRGATLCLKCMENYKNFPRCKICNESIQDRKRNSRYCKKCSANKIKQYQEKYRRTHKKLQVKK